MTKLPHQCLSCGKLFKTAREHMLHIGVHDRGYVPREQMTRRTVSCWRCASDMPVPEGDNPYTCSCGFVLPPKLNARQKEEPSADN